MKSFAFLAVCIAVAAALPLDIIEDEEGQEYVAIPIHRQRRDLTYGANQNGYSLGQKGTLWSNENHQIDGAYEASKAWRSHGLKPDAFGGQVDYTHKSSGTSAFVGADRSPGYGTDLNAGVKYDIAHGKNWNVDVTGQYGRHYGGPGGTGKPEASAFLNVGAKI